jgi:hypothetical protein
MSSTLVKSAEDAGINEPFRGTDGKVWIEVAGMPGYSSYLGPFENAKEAMNALWVHYLGLARQSLKSPNITVYLVE